MVVKVEWKNSSWDETVLQTGVLEQADPCRRLLGQGYTREALAGAREHIKMDITFKHTNLHGPFYTHSDSLQG